MKSLLALKSYFIRYRKLFVLGIVYILFSTIFQVIAPALIRSAIDSLSQEVSRAALLKYAGLVLLVSAISGVFLYMTRRTIIDASRHIEYDIRNDFLRHIQKLSLRYFQNTATGDIMAHATNDIGAVRMFVGPAVMYSANTAFTFLMILGLMLSIHPFLTLLTLLPMPIVSYVVHVLGKRIHKRYDAIQAHYSVLTARAQENISGMRVVKAYVREEYEIERFRVLSEEYRHRNMRMVKLQAIMIPVITFLVGGSGTILLWYGGSQVIAGHLTLGELTQIMMYLGMLIWPVIAIGWVINIIQRASASMMRLQKIWDQVPEISDSEQTDMSVQTISGGIDFKHLSFRYNDTLDPVLNDIQLSVPAGTTLAVIGYTGSGKTTLVNLIPRLYDCTGGTLSIDGKDVRTIPVETLRKHIAYVTQETFLFSDTIKANIGYGVDDVNMERVQWAAGISRIDKDIADFPQGYDTILGERGITLSGGQKQRISIARAVMRDPAILILDDALSAVDTHTEEEILKQLKGVMKGRTSIIISHRISTVKNADRIIVLDEGIIKESGTHEELIAADGIYADLHYKQLLAEEIEDIE